jgi:hypothetical protein
VSSHQRRLPQAEVAVQRLVGMYPYSSSAYTAGVDKQATTSPTTPDDMNTE